MNSGKTELKKLSDDVDPQRKFFAEIHNGTNVVFKERETYETIDRGMLSNANVFDIENETKSNTFFRKVIFTVKDEFQVVLMSIEPGQDIGMEKHPKTTQFVRIEQGTCVASIGGKETFMKDGFAAVVPPNTWHNFTNTSQTESLKIYTIYSPPEHAPGEIQKKK